METKDEDVVRLSGSLREFPVVDVFQFLLVNRKDGELRLEDKQRGLRASVFFAGKGYCMPNAGP